MGTIEEFKNQLKLRPKTYQEAKLHSKNIDLLLGFQCEAIEKALSQDKDSFLNSHENQYWYGLDSQSLQTPYSEIVDMIECVKPKSGDSWVDLGAGYGRMGLVLSVLAPETKFLGFEFVANRVAEGVRIYKKWNLNLAKLSETNLADRQFELPEADVYFVYDFGSRQDFDRLLEKMGAMARQKEITLIARGRGVRNWIMMDYPWLHSSVAPEHYSTWSLFRS